ncbi:MAG: hypothetical protein ACJ71K_04800 [Nitrososphaeraceae archaeon]
MTSIPYSTILFSAAILCRGLPLSSGVGSGTTQATGEATSKPAATTGGGTTTATSTSPSPTSPSSPLLFNG